MLKLLKPHKNEPQYSLFCVCFIFHDMFCQCGSEQGQALGRSHNVPLCETPNPPDFMPGAFYFLLKPLVDHCRRYNPTERPRTVEVVRGCESLSR